MRLFPLMVLAILSSSLLPFSTMNAYALNCESTQTGFWDLSSTWINCGGGVPGDNDNVTIKNGDTVTIRTDIRTVPLVGLSLTVEQSAELVLDGPSGGNLQIKLGTFTNFGKTTLAGVGGPNTSAELRLVVTPGTNECGATIDVNGGSITNAGHFIIANGVFVNKGTINLSGGVGNQAGTLGITGDGGQVDNHGTINENPGAGLDSGIVLAVGGGIFNDNLPNLCPIDIKPGSDPNSINTKSMGTIPVAILSTPDFDALEVDKTTLTFGKNGDEDSLAFCTKSNEDVNSDGLLDVVCHFVQKDTGLAVGDTQACITGALLDGTPFSGCDAVIIVK